jgi:hypothetical protein
MTILTNQIFSVAHIAEGQAPLRCDHFAGAPERCPRRATFVYRERPYCLEHATHLMEREMAGLLLDVQLELERLRAMSKNKV